jgi:hypothetical protein
MPFFTADGISLSYLAPSVDTGWLVVTVSDIAARA